MSLLIRFVLWVDQQMLSCHGSSLSPQGSTVSTVSHCFTTCSLKDWNSLLLEALKKKSNKIVWGKPVIKRRAAVEKSTFSSNLFSRWSC